MMTKFEKVMKPFVGFVLSNTDLDYDNYQINWDAFDGRRIYLALDGGEYSYFIRTWNITNEGIDFTLFDDSGAEARDILHGYYHYKPLPSCMYVY